MTVRHGIAIVLTLVPSLSAPAAAQKDAPVADVLRATGEYLAAYAPKVSGVALQEEYTLLDVTGGRITSTERLSSDVVLVNLSGRVVALRDAYAIDNNALRERQPRISALLAKPSLAAWEQAQTYAGESTRHMKDSLIAWSNEPTAAMRFVEPASQGRVTYRINGRKRMDGVEVVGLRFEETKRPDASYIVTTPGKATASGRLWVEADTGRIHRTELSLQSEAESARIEVDYTRDSKLDLLIPKEMSDSYDIKEPTGSNSYFRRSFQGTAYYSNVRFTPVDLSVAK